MNRVVGVGIALVIVTIIAIIGVTYSMSSSNTNEDNLLTVEDVNLEESLALEEEIISEEPEQAGQEFSVELTERIGIKTP